MATKGTCSTKECGRTVQKDGFCYKCFKAKHGHAPYPGQDHKKPKDNKVKSVSQSVRKRSPSVPSLPSKDSIGGPSGAHALAGGIDWTKYPKLHSRLISFALDQVLTELETQA